MTCEYTLALILYNHNHEINWHAKGPTFDIFIHWDRGDQPPVSSGEKKKNTRRDLNNARETTTFLGPWKETAWDF